MDENLLLLFLALTLALAVGLYGITRRLSWVGEQAGMRFSPERLVRLERARWVLFGLAFLPVLVCAALLSWNKNDRDQQYKSLKVSLVSAFQKDAVWQSPDWALTARDPQEALIAYGRDLIAHTADYYGTKGCLRPGSINDLNCQNCHLDAGSKPYGNNYSAVASTYPKTRARSGKSETIAFRVNDCFQRSLNGLALDTNGREMRAIVAYIRWLGLGVPGKVAPKGSGLLEVPMLDRAADPVRGQAVFASKCASCHGVDGQGLPIPDSPRWYPPLWGERSYSASAGLFRLSRFAGYVKANMPFGANWLAPQLSDEEAWDVAAYVNSQPRPAHKFLAEDWPDISKKPFDHPYGPYADGFSEQQHKYGPFQPILDFYKKK